MVIKTGKDDPQQNNVKKIQKEAKILTAKIYLGMRTAYYTPPEKTTAGYVTA